MVAVAAPAGFGGDLGGSGALPGRQWKSCSRGCRATGLKRAELDDDFVSPVLAVANRPGSCQRFWDDVDKLKPPDFKTEVLFDPVDTLYRRKHGLTVTGNHSLRDPADRERLHPAIVLRLDDMCRVAEV